MQLIYDLRTPTGVCCVLYTDSSVIEHRARDRKIVGPWFDSRMAMRRCVLGKDTLLLFSIGAKQSTRYGGPAQTKDLQIEPKKSALRWCGLDRRSVRGSH